MYFSKWVEIHKLFLVIQTFARTILLGVDEKHRVYCVDIGFSLALLWRLTRVSWSRGVFESRRTTLRDGPMPNKTGGIWTKGWMVHYQFGRELYISLSQDGQKLKLLGINLYIWLDLFNVIVFVCTVDNHHKLLKPSIWDIWNLFQASEANPNRTFCSSNFYFIFSCQWLTYTPWKTNMEHNHVGKEDYVPFQMGDL